MLAIRISPIQGHGLFTTEAITEGAKICLIWKTFAQTLYGRYTNHNAENPNVRVERNDKGEAWLYAKRDIAKNEELTCDYEDFITAVKADELLAAKVRFWVKDEPEEETEN